MKYTFSSNLVESEFDQFAQKHPHGTFFQSSSWARVKDNWTPIYTGVYKDNELVAAALVLKRSLILGYSFMYAPRGPLLDFNNKDLLNYYLEELKQLSKEHKSLSLTLDPYVVRATYPMEAAMRNKIDISYDDSIVNYFHDKGYRRKELGLELHDTIQPRFQPTIYFDEKLRYRNSRGYKNGIKALNNNVKIEQLEINEMDRFIDVINKTEDYKNINLRNKGYFDSLITSFQEKSFLSIAYLDLKAEYESLQASELDMKKRLENKNMRESRIKDYENKLRHFIKDKEYIYERRQVLGDRVDIAGILALRNTTKAELLYAGMDRDFQKYLGSNLNYNYPIDWALESKCESVCFGGSTGHFKDGISRYKVSFNPTLDEYIGEFVYTNKRVLNFFFNTALEIRKKIRE